MTEPTRKSMAGKLDGVDSVIGRINEAIARNAITPIIYEHFGVLATAQCQKIQQRLVSAGWACDYEHSWGKITFTLW